MRTIIAGTDFSESSLNACRYAASLAQKLKCKLVIFNLFDAPVVHSNVGLYGFSYASIKGRSQEKATKLVDQLKKSFPGLTIKAFIKSGSFKDELSYFVEEHQVVAAVMGLEAKEKISKFIYGTHGVSLAGKIECPVIIVPSRYKNHDLTKVLLAVDSNEKLLKSSLKGFEKFIKQTGSHLDILHVRTPMEFFDPKTETLKFNGQKLPIHVIRSKNLEDGIKKRCAETRSDMIAVISKKHSVFYNFFSESNTKRIAFSTKVPVMSIHE